MIVTIGLYVAAFILSVNAARCIFRIYKDGESATDRISSSLAGAICTWGCAAVALTIWGAF